LHLILIPNFPPIFFEIANNEATPSTKKNWTEGYKNE